MKNLPQLSAAAVLLLATAPAQAVVKFTNTATRPVFLRVKSCALESAGIEMQLHATGATPKPQTLTVTSPEGKVTPPPPVHRRIPTTASSSPNLVLFDPGTEVSSDRTFALGPYSSLAFSANGGPEGPGETNEIVFSILTHPDKANREVLLVSGDPLVTHDLELVVEVPWSRGDAPEVRLRKQETKSDLPGRPPETFSITPRRDGSANLVDQGDPADCCAML